MIEEEFEEEEEIDEPDFEWEYPTDDEEGFNLLMENEE
jgi:hypothetical protein